MIQTQAHKQDSYKKDLLFFVYLEDPAQYFIETGEIWLTLIDNY
jgi:hypothetical protein